MANIKSQKPATQFLCESCDYRCCNKFDYNKHLATRKHIMTNNTNETSHKIAKTYICKNCNSEYKHQSSLCKHVKTCQTKPLPPINVLYQETNINALINQLITDNKELRNFIIEQATEHKNFIIEQASEHKKENMEIVNKVIETNKTTVINQTNNQTNNNQKFNINVFLNEHCKDAMNLSDFIKNIEVSREDLENNAQLGFVGGISKIFLDNLRQLSINERPIHCTDLKRETMYIKEDDKWTKETGSTKLNTAILTITQKSTRTLLDWKKENPDYKDHDSEFSTRCIVIQRNSMAGHDRDTYYPKVIRAIAKETMVDK
jgi:hypothetical protein